MSAELSKYVLSTSDQHLKKLLDLMSPDKCFPYAALSPNSTGLFLDDLISDKLL